MENYFLLLQNSLEINDGLMIELFDWMLTEIVEIIKALYKPPQLCYVYFTGFLNNT